MSGKTAGIAIVVLIIIVLIITWFWMEQVIEKFDIDRAMTTTNQLVTSVKGAGNWFNIA